MKCKKSEVVIRKSKDPDRKKGGTKKKERYKRNATEEREKRAPFII